MSDREQSREMAKALRAWCRIGVFPLEDEVIVNKIGAYLLDVPQRKMTGPDAAWRGRVRMAMHLGATRSGDALTFPTHESFCDWAVWVLELGERACEVTE